MSYSFDTLAVHAGQTPDPVHGARALPIYQTTAYVYPDTREAASRYALDEIGPIYTRLDNPTSEVIEKRVAALEGGVGALSVASGQAATTLAFLTLGGAGSHIVSSPSIYGGSYNVLHHTFAKLGIDVTFVEDPNDPESWRAAATPNTIAFFGEALANPKLEILDIEPVAKVAHEVGVPLIVDNTTTTPYLIRAIEWGADIVVSSATKYLGGHGVAMGGIIVDAGTFDYSQHPDRFPGFNNPDPSYNGVIYAKDFGKDGRLGANLAFILKARAQGLRDLGQCQSPFNSFLLALGIETLGLRMTRHSETTLDIARWLEAHDGVRSVAYPGLESSPSYELSKKYLPKGSSGVLSFILEGGAEAGEAFANALELHSLVANIGDVRSLVIHPASTTHAQLTEEEKLSAGVDPGLIRLSIGLEDVDDLKADLEKGFAAAAQISTTKTGA